MEISVVLAGSLAGYSGGDLHTQRVVDAWRGAGHRVEVALPRGSSPELTRLLGKPGRRGAAALPSRPRIAALYGVRMIGLVVRSGLARGRVDVAVASSHYLYDLAPVMARRARHRGVYWHHHVEGSDHRLRWVHLLVRASEWASLTLVRSRRVNVLTSSPATRAHLIARGLDPDRVHLTLNSHSLETVARAPADLPHLLGSPFVLFCGRLSRLKGTEELRAVVGAVLGRSDAQMVIIGPPGDDSDRLRSDLEAGGHMSRTSLLGFVDEATKSWLFQHAHVVVAPSHEEGWSIAVNDGLVSGAHVVTYSLPAVVSAFPEGPRFVPPGDVAGFCDAVLSCLAIPRSHGPAHPDEWSNIAERDLENLLG